MGSRGVKQSPHTGNTGHPGAWVSQECQYYTVSKCNTMNTSLDHESLELPWVYLYSNIYIITPWIYIYTMSQCLNDKSMSQPMIDFYIVHE